MAAIEEEKAKEEAKAKVMPTKRISPDSRFQPVVDFYFAEFERRHGSKPLWDGSDGMALGRILYSQKQLPMEKLKALVETAFQWSDAWWGPVRKGDFCPLQPGFRFREFCAHFPKVVVRMQGQMPGARCQVSERPRVTAQQVTKIFREYGDRVVGAHDARQKWDQILRRTLGISYDEAHYILSGEPVRPEREP